MADVAVYEIWVEGEMLYIGCSQNPHRRCYAHRARRPLAGWPEYRVVKWFRSRKAALRFEAKLIKERKPVLNSHHTGRRRPDRISLYHAREIWLYSRGKKNAEVLAKMPGWTYETAMSEFGPRSKR